MKPILVGLALLLGLAADTPPDAGKDIQRLKGSWVVVSVESPKGRKHAAQIAEQFKEAELTFAEHFTVLGNPFAGHSLIFAKKGKEKDETRCMLYPSTNPKGIDLLIGEEVHEGGLNRRKIWELHGIYLLDGDDLTICTATEFVFYDQNGPSNTETNRRPVRFDPKSGILLTLKRAKKEATRPAPPTKDPAIAQPQDPKSAAIAPQVKSSKDLHFHRRVPTSDLEIELTPAAKATKYKKAIFLPVKLTNRSPDKISATLAHEWHGGLWPPTGLYASVSLASDLKESAFVPVYLVGESAKETVATILTTGTSKEITLRMDWRGTGSVPARPLMESAGTYRMQLLMVFEASGKQQYVTSPLTTIEVPGDKPVGPKPEPWTGEPAVPVKWVSGGKLSTFKRLPKAEDVTALRISPISNRTKVDLTAANFPIVLNSMKPVQADDPKYKEWSYAPWYSAEFETSAGRFQATFYLGDLALLGAPDGSVGLVTYERPKMTDAPASGGDKIKRENSRGFDTSMSGEFLARYWDSLTDDNKMKGKVSDHLTKAEIDSIVVLEVRISIAGGPQDRTAQDELLAFMSEGNRFDTGRLPEGFEQFRKYVVGLIRTKKGDYGLITRYSTFAVIELNGVVGVAHVGLGGLLKKAEPPLPEKMAPVTPEMHQSLAKFKKVDAGAKNEVVEAALAEFFNDLQRFEPKIFLPAALGDLMRLAPKDPRTRKALRDGLAKHWLEPNLAHAMLIKVGDDPKRHLQTLIKNLGSDVPNTRRAALEAIRGCGPRAKEALPILQKIIDDAKAPASDYQRAYRRTDEVPEHVLANWAKTVIEAGRLAPNEIKESQNAPCWDPKLFEGASMFESSSAFQKYLVGANAVVIGEVINWDGEKGTVRIEKSLHGKAEKEISLAHGGGVVRVNAGNKVIVLLKEQQGAIRLHSFCGASGLYRYSEDLQKIVETLLAAKK